MKLLMRPTNCEYTKHSTRVCLSFISSSVSPGQSTNGSSSTQGGYRSSNGYRTGVSPSQTKRGGVGMMGLSPKSNSRSMGYVNVRLGPREYQGYAMYMYMYGITKSMLHVYTMYVIHYFILLFSS